MSFVALQVQIGSQVQVNIEWRLKNLLVTQDFYWQQIYLLRNVWNTVAEGKNQAQKIKLNIMQTAGRKEFLNHQGRDTLFLMGGK